MRLAMKSAARRRGFGLLVLVIEARGDRVMRVVGLVDEIGDRQLQLMRPQPARPRRAARGRAAPEIEQDVRGLRDQHRRRPSGKAAQRAACAAAAPSISRCIAATPLAAARDVDIFGARLLQRQAHEFAAPLNRRPVIELVGHAHPGLKPVECLACHSRDPAYHRHSAGY